MVNGIHFIYEVHIFFYRASFNQHQYRSTGGKISENVFPHKHSFLVTLGLNQMCFHFRAEVILSAHRYFLQMTL